MEYPRIYDVRSQMYDVRLPDNQKTLWDEIVVHRISDFVHHFISGTGSNIPPNKR
jgi:hypothetical protein